ncbi:hypothetical protein GLOIN_2v1835724 [Rhizophagus clarus]|uniref:Uncharacterized protein n=1 Tax=Rhizophagus clarus TaxID=94130 RepID=A0A8H3LF91_9GLOM|nr:hypothetical protein GLOIN_2v1835724 [Rhizophagus clarus]
MDHEPIEPSINQTTNVIQMERASSNVSYSNLNISYDFSNTTSYTISNSSSYASLTIRRRRDQRRLRHRITTNTYTLNHMSLLRQLPRQNTNDPFADQIFNGTEFY